jgi:hypothetical protein
MDADTANHSEERIVFSGVDPHIMKMVIIKHPVIYHFAGSMVIANLLIFIRTSGHRGDKAGCPSPVLCKHSDHRRRGNTFLCRAGICFAADKLADLSIGI